MGKANKQLVEELETPSQPAREAGKPQAERASSGGRQAMERIEVTIVDKETFFRSGLCQALEVLECDPTHLMTVIEARSPDVILLDIDYPSLGGLELCRKIARRFPRTSVVILTPNVTAEELVEVIRSGAAAYLSKSATVEELAKAIKQACLGGYPINDIFAATPNAAKQVLKQSRDMVSIGKAAQRGDIPLSLREIQILNCIASGCSNKQIAAILQRSEQTVKNHMSSILRKLDACDRAHAVALAMRSGLIAVEEDLSALPRTKATVL